MSLGAAASSGYCWRTGIGGAGRLRGGEDMGDTGATGDARGGSERAGRGERAGTSG